MLSTIRSLSKEQFNQIVDLRRYLHQHPELSFKEANTAMRIAQELDNIGIPYFSGIGKTGIVAIINGNLKGPTIGIRAELDALPIHEQTGLEFSSINSDAMHACGHDVHMANLIGAAKILWKMRNDIKGKILLIFQPGEELLPGGALSIINSNVFQQNTPDLMLGAHILPELQAGKVGFHPGPYMASGDEIYLTVKGKGGHAAMPHTLVDPIVIASHIVLAMQQVVSRNAPIEVPTVLSFGRIVGNGATNVIPDKVDIEGTFRTMNEEWRAKAHKIISEKAKGIAQSMGGDCEVEIRKGYPALCNNPEFTALAKDYAKEYLGNKEVANLPIRTTADDFAYYAQSIPSVYFRVGSGFVNGGNAGLHSANMIVNEHVIEHTGGLLAWLVASFIGKLQ
jgi:amidohydrolase